MPNARNIVLQIAHHLGMSSSIRSQGHSLIDTLFVLFILALSGGMAASAMQSLRTSARLQSTAEALHSAVLSARTQAMRLEKRVTLCAAAAAASTPDSLLPIRCHQTSDGNGLNVWRQGWLLFEDDNNNGTWDVNEGRLQQQAAVHADVSVSGNATVRRFVSFGASGRSLALNGAFQAGTLTVCQRQTQEASGWRVVVNAVGRPRLEKTTISDCAD
jgi:type IV fimbrial biogenesis protein FimT